MNKWMNKSKLFMVLILFLSFLLGPSLVLAGEEGKPEGEAAGGEKKDVPEWMEIQTHINALATKISMKIENINHLIEEKKNLPANSPEVKSVIDEMVSEHKELQQMISDRNKEEVILKYRFPERGAKEERNYKPIELKSLDQMEQDLGLDGRLSRNMKKVHSQYGPSPSTSATSESSKGEKPKSLPAAEHQKSIEESDPVILKK